MAAPNAVPRHFTVRMSALPDSSVPQASLGSSPPRSTLQGSFQGSPPRSSPPKLSFLRSYVPASLYEKDASLYEKDEPRGIPVRPTPAPAISAYDFADPLLALTPEKPTLKHSTRYTDSLKSSLNTRSTQKYTSVDRTVEHLAYPNGIDNTLDSSKGSQRVRFDSTVKVKTMSPYDTSTETSRIESTGSSNTFTDSSMDDMIDTPVVERANANVTPRQLLYDTVNTSSTSSSASDGAHFSNNTSGSSGSSKTSGGVSISTCNSDDMEPLDVIADDGHARDRHIYGRKLAKHKKSCAVRTSMWGQDGLGDNVLARPEFNSTVILQKQLEGLKTAEVDLEQEVKKKLATSEPLQSKVDEKASLKVNHPRGFEGLPSLDVREEDVLKRAETTKMKVAGKHQKSSRPLTQSDLIPAPDIMDCWKDEFMKESLCLSTDHIPRPKLTPRPAPHSSGFDVYRRMRAWEGWN